MPKNLIQDMVKIKIVKNIERPRKAQAQFNDFTPKPRYGIWLVAGGCLIFLFFALSFLFSQATVTITPKMQSVTVNENLSGSKDGSIGDLPFDLVIISGEENKSVQTSSIEEVSKKALGTVVLYNAFGASSQLFATDTRLEGSNGKMYKTLTPITVPGMAKDSIPGRVEVKIYGSVSGEEYNSAPLDFKIFGFKGTPKYSKFYGRSKGEITGGFEGKMPIISNDQKTSIEKELEATLQTKLSKKATDQIPSGFILFKDASFLNIDSKDTLPTADKTIWSMTQKGTFYGFLFDEKKLTEKIAKDSIENYDGSEVYIPNIRELVFSLPDKANISFKDVTNINFNLSGTAQIVWKFDAGKLASELLSKSKKDFNQILSQYSNIDSANLKLSPIWAFSIPSKSKDIKVIVNYPPHL